MAPTGACATAVGPGAALVLADETGRVARYVPDLASLPEDGLTACDVTVVDQGEIVDAAAGRGESLAELDDALARVMAETERGTRVLVAGISAGPVGEPGLQVVVDWRRGEPTGRWLHSPSTQKDGIVQLVDLTATVVDEAGGSTEGLDGAALGLGETRRMDVARTVENRQYLNVLTSTIPALYPALVGLLVATLVLTLGGACGCAARRRAAASRPGQDRPAAAWSAPCSSSPPPRPSPRRSRASRGGGCGAPRHPPSRSRSLRAPWPSRSSRGAWPACCRAGRGPCPRRSPASRGSSSPSTG
ncbi:hypothetical protein [Cellulosimicrobium sp. CUA-896]|uniref:hypothetical protein n=1 Tax=Cellulosimicrobium sp. CUA-896 TaxID=1517881 RepID=UPI0009FB897E|nr:hypothetical protein [Cellulosimicrobium sp. CUA-896]